MTYLNTVAKFDTTGTVMQHFHLEV